MGECGKTTRNRGKVRGACSPAGGCRSSGCGNADSLEVTSAESPARCPPREAAARKLSFFSQSAEHCLLLLYCNQVVLLLVEIATFNSVQRD